MHIHVPFCCNNLIKKWKNDVALESRQLLFWKVGKYDQAII